MTTKNPYQVVKHLHVTEKAQMLGSLHSAESNLSLSRFKLPKHVFIVDKNANKQEIAHAVQTIYPGVKVVAVNTIQVKPKATRLRGRRGEKKGFKKAIVTLEENDTLEERS